MSRTETVVVKLVVDGNEAQRGLDKFDKGMSGAGNAADIAAAKIQRAMQAQALGLPVLKETTAAISREERAWQSLASKADPIAATRIRNEREMARAVATATNAVTGGYATQEAALTSLTKLEALHAAKLQDIATATNMVTAASQRRASADRMAAMTRQNLVYQGQDIAVQLAGGQNPALIAMQQLPQILSGPGGANAALKETGNLAMMAVTRFGPLAAVIGAASAAIAGMQNEINKTSSTTVSFGDTALAVWQVIAGGVADFLKPVTDKIVEWFGIAWDWVAEATRNVGNTIVREIVGAVEIIKTTITSIPDAFTVAGEAAANGFIGAIEWMVQKALEGFQSLIDGANSFINSIGGDKVREFLGIGTGAPKLYDSANPFTLGRADIGGAAAQDRLNAGWGDLGTQLGGIRETDYMGQFFGAVQQQAIENARAGIESVGGAAKAAKEAATGLGAALTDAAKAAQAEWEFYRGTFSGFFGDLKAGLMDGKGLWESFGSAASNALSKIADRALGMAADGIFNMLFGAFGSIAGGAAIPMGGFIPGLTGPKLFANGGLVSGPGTGTSDSIPARLSAGEFVVKASATAKHLDVLQAINGGRVMGFANGGLVPPPGGEAGGELILERRLAA